MDDLGKFTQKNIIEPFKDLFQNKTEQEATPTPAVPEVQERQSIQGVPSAKSVPKEQSIQGVPSVAEAQGIQGVQVAQPVSDLHEVSNEELNSKIKAGFRY